MMNKLAKGLVLAQILLSVAAMAWASTVVLNRRDFGWMEPYREVVERKPDGADKTAVRYVSEYDKSVAALKEAGKLRDITYMHVQPAIDSLRTTEPYLPNNHLFYLTERQRLLDAAGEIEVKRFKPDMEVDPAGSNLGKAGLGEKVEGVTKSAKTYHEELKKLYGDIDEVSKDIRKILTATQEFTKELTGTDELNRYVQPGLYQLTDVEFRTQQQIKIEIDNIKPQWSKAGEQARGFRQRYDQLRATEKQLLEFIAANDKKKKN